MMMMMIIMIMIRMIIILTQLEISSSDFQQVPTNLSLGKFKRTLKPEGHFGEQCHFQKTPCIVRR